MYTHAILGGTFDHLHAGHRAFLTHAFSIANHVTIGLTSDRYVKMHKQTIPADEETISGVGCPCIGLSRRQSYKERIDALTKWLDSAGFASRYTVVAIADAVGPSGTMEADVLVVSEETKEGARRVNAERKRHGLPKLAVSVVSMKKSEDTLPISSTRVRHREITQDGSLVLPDALRPELICPIGDLVPEKQIAFVVGGDEGKCVITVGDKTTDRLLDSGVVPTLAIIDGHVERKSYNRTKTHWDMLPSCHIACASGPGFISSAAVSFFGAWGRDVLPTTLVISGEEDLLVLPAILYAPVGAIVYYGQPHVGLVRVVVTDEKQMQVQQLLAEFTKIG